MKGSEKMANENDSSMFTDYPDIVDVSQIQVMLNISRHLAYSLINSGEIKGIKIGHSYRVPKNHVIDYVCGRSE